MPFNKIIIIRISKEEDTILTNLVEKENIDVKNVSEDVRFCINYNTIVLGRY